MGKLEKGVGAGKTESVVRDELLECLLGVASLHDHQASADAIVGGLPLENGRLIPSLMPRAAARAGMAARLVKARITQLNEALLPAILLLEPGRACILLSLNEADHSAQVIFPGLTQASVAVNLDRLIEVYSGHALYIRPRLNYKPKDAEVSTDKQQHWFWGAIRENRPLYRDIVLGSLLINLFALGMPLFALNVYDRVVPNHTTETLWVLVIGVGIVICLDLVMRLMRNTFIDMAASRADIKISSRLMSQVLNMRMEARSGSTGSMASTLQSFESIRAFIGSATVISMVDLPFALLFVAIIGLICPPLVLPLLVGIVFVLLYALAAQGKLHELSSKTWEVSAQRNAMLIESLGNLETVKSLRAESRLQRLWEKNSAFLSRTSAQLKLVSSSVSSVAMWAQNSVGVSIIVIGVYQIIQGDLTQGGLIASYMLSSRAMGPISQAAALLAQYHQSSTALSSLNEMMEKPTERDRQASFVNRPTVQGEVTFDKVSLQYPDEMRTALRDVSITIRPGEKVALLGRIGSGKSTLNKLLLGLYQPSSGSVRLDGLDIRQMDPSQLRRYLGYVPQDVALFRGTLRENILATRIDRDVDDEVLLRALEISGLNALVKQHPDGIDLQVGERGSMLSGGQRQSVAIARAVVHDPAILMLDEPTSAMDHASEEAFKKQLAGYIQGKTLMLVTHRTALLSLVERIIVMDNGQVVADGPRDQVVEALRRGQIGGAR